MNNKKGVDTLAQRNSPITVYKARQIPGTRPKHALLTIESTVRGTIGSGVASTWGVGNALGMGILLASSSSTTASGCPRTDTGTLNRRPLPPSGVAISWSKRKEQEKERKEESFEPEDVERYVRRTSTRSSERKTCNHPRKNEASRTCWKRCEEGVTIGLKTERDDRPL